MGFKGGRLQVGAKVSTPTPTAIPNYSYLWVRFTLAGAGMRERWPVNHSADTVIARRGTCVRGGRS